MCCNNQLSRNNHCLYQMNAMVTHQNHSNQCQPMMVYVLHLTNWLYGDGDDVVIVVVVAAAVGDDDDGVKQHIRENFVKSDNQSIHLH